MFQHQRYRREEKGCNDIHASIRYQHHHQNSTSKYEPPVDYSEDDEIQQHNSSERHRQPAATRQHRRYHNDEDDEEEEEEDEDENDDCDGDGDEPEFEEEEADVHCISTASSQLPLINFRQLTLERLLGQGGFGKVYRARYHAHLVAVKEPIYFESGRAAAVNAAITEEARLHYHLSHPNIIRLYGISITSITPTSTPTSTAAAAAAANRKVLLVMEYAHGGSLREVISRDRLKSLSCSSSRNGALILPPSIIIRFATQIASAVEYLHSFRPRAIIHRDLKSPNILLNEPLTAESNWRADRLQLKLTDLGLAQEFTHSTKMSQCGTYAWMAPECITESTFSKASDVWSFAVVLWELLTGQIPYRDFSGPAIAFGVGNGRLSLPIPTTCPEELKRILQACWSRQPKARPSFAEIRAQLEASSFNVINGEAFEKMKRRWFAEVETIWEGLKEKEAELDCREQEARRKEAETRRKEAEVERLKRLLKAQSEELRRREIEVVSRELNVLLQQQQEEKKELLMATTAAAAARRPHRQQQRKKKALKKAKDGVKGSSSSTTRIGYPQNFCHNLTVTSNAADQHQFQSAATAAAGVPFLQARALNQTWGPGTKVRPQLHLSLFSQSASSSKCDDLDHEDGNNHEEAESRRRKSAKVKKIGSFLRRLFGSSKSNLRRKSSAREEEDEDDDNENATAGRDNTEENYAEEGPEVAENDFSEPTYEDFDEAEHSRQQLMLSGAATTTALLSRTYHGQTKHSERKRLNLYEHFTQYIDHYHRQEESSSEEEEGEEEDEDEYEAEVASYEEEECTQQLPTTKYHHQYHQQYFEKPQPPVFSREERRSIRRTNDHDFNNNNSNSNEHSGNSSSSTSFYNRHQLQLQLPHQQPPRSGHSTSGSQAHSQASSRSNCSSSHSKGSTTASLPSEHFDEDLLQEFNRFEREFQSMNCPPPSSS